ncbi:MAG: PHP domain-containing protein [Candidatus Bipolaricaulota bacterium]
MRFERENADFHIHSRYSSDGHLEPEKIIALAEKNDLETIAVTDHDTVKGGRETRKKAEERGTDLNVVVGAEINTDRGDIIGLGLREEIQTTELHETIEEIKEQGGEVYLPHPFDKFRRSALGEYAFEVAEKLDYVEIFNGRCLLNSFDRQAENFADKYGLAKLVGSDSHFGFEMGNLSPGVGRFTKALLAHFLTKLNVRL